AVKRIKDDATITAVDVDGKSATLTVADKKTGARQTLDVPQMEGLFPRWESLFIDNELPAMTITLDTAMLATLATSLHRIAKRRGDVRSYVTIRVYPMAGNMAHAEKIVCEVTAENGQAAKAILMACAPVR